MATITDSTQKGFLSQPAFSSAEIASMTKTTAPTTITSSSRTTSTSSGGSSSSSTPKVGDVTGYTRVGNDVYDAGGNYVSFDKATSLGIVSKLDSIPQATSTSKVNTSTNPAAQVSTGQYVRTAGTNEVYDTVSKKYVSYQEAVQKGLFNPGAVQDVTYKLPDVATTGYGGKNLTPYEMSKVGSVVPPVPTDVEVNAAFQDIQDSREALRAANAELNAASGRLKEMQLMDNAEIKSIATNPELTRRLAQRRISFINDPQSEYWLQRIALQNEVDSARGAKEAAVEDVNLAIKMFEISKPDLIDSKVNSEGHLIQIYSNPMNPGNPTVMDLGGGYGDEGKIVEQQIVDVGGQKVMYATIKDSSVEGGYRYEQRVLGTSDAAYKARTTGVNTGGSPIVAPVIGANGTPVISTVQAGQMTTALTAGSKLKTETERGKVEGAVAVIQLGEELKALLKSGNVKTGPISGTIRAGPSGAADVVGQAGAGAAAGAALGSVVPGIGTAIGGIAGGIIGGISGLITNIPGTQALGTTSPEWNQFFAKASQMTSAYGKSVSGAAVSDQEFERLSATTPSVYAQETVNLERIQALQDAANRTIQNLTGVSITY